MPASRLAVCAAALALFLPAAVAAQALASPGSTATLNTATTRAAFDAWAAGQASVFDLLAEDVVWTVAGTSPVSGTYRSRADFMERAVAPISSRLATPIVPQVEAVIAQGDDVVVLWQGTATTRSGAPYANRYAWRMTFAEGAIVQVTAFLDTWALDAMMRSETRATRTAP
ncbi:nuclear transport factor 2 family protein [Luteimonas deserti]|uniref:Nuclear transport factor 2 family protein n=1 Tax=Luteimonas deserti TaxID=2752306 RepID=A0A7Z0TTL7_9GAMM|nr:nuclear transport factor 2 family protein [Luteimonas deserti]NYZ61926.1 nuclear transport factor 2 family protein [Luteimonas deserti]